MRWMIASDIHGSEYYCKKLLEAYDRENAGRGINIYTYYRVRRRIYHDKRKHYFICQNFKECL